MGLFDFLRGDPVARAQKALEQNDPRGALAALAKADGDPTAERLRARAQGALVASLIDKADGAESSGYLGDAADWLRTALEEMADDAPEQDAVRERLSGLETRLGEDAAAVAAAEHAGALQVAPNDGSPSAAEGLEIHPDDLFENLVETLRDEVAWRYRRSSDAVRHAWVYVNQGEPRRAIELLADVPPEDALAALERGRALLSLGATGEAVPELDRAWQDLGDEPLDEAASLSVPQLWAEAALDQGEAAEVVTRLAALAEGGERNDLAEGYAQGLAGSARAADAVAFIRRALDRGADHGQLVPLLADALDAVGQEEDAIAELEGLIAPSCASGSCQKPPLHVGAVRAVVARYLARGGEDNLEQARVHLERLLSVRKGVLELPDLEHLIAYHHATGEPERAAELEATRDRQLARA